MVEKTCCRCHTIKAASEFFRDSRATDGLQSRCKSCSHDFKEYYARNKQKYKDHAARRRAQIKAWIQQIKAERGCAVCGETKHWRLDFHHVNNDKEENISRMLASGLAQSRIQTEIHKCEVLCRNHHADIHFGDVGEVEIPHPS